LNEQTPVSLMRVPIAGLLAWLVPGLGHIFLGERARGLIFLIAITTTFWSGVAIGSVQGTVAPHSRKLWFVAQLGTGGNALAAYGLHRVVSPESAMSPAPAILSHWLSAEVGVHYTGVAGLLNILVILDALGRAERTNPSSRRRQRSGTELEGVT
jgi:hypothetical protein